MIEVKYKRGKNPNSRNGWKKGENHTGMLGKTHSKETRNKISDANKANPTRYWLGKKRPNIAKQMSERVVSDETKKRMSESQKGKKMPPRSKEHLARLSKNNARYWQGKKQSVTTRTKRSNSMLEVLDGEMPKNTRESGTYGNIKRGWYDINGKEMFFRSKWEANYALYLDFLIKQNQIKGWEFEKDVFVFHKIQFGTRSYRPDFKVFNNDDSIEYHEVKGYMDSKSKTKLKRMTKYYPDTKIVLIERDTYSDIKKKLGRVCGFFD
jgi:hypothetical protein